MIDIEGKFKNIITALLKFFFRSHPGAEIDKRSISSILVIRQHDQLGDMLCAIPLLHILSENFPGASIILVTSPVNYQIMLNQPYLTEVINYDKRVWWRSIPAIWKFFTAIRSRKFDLAVVPGTVSVSMTSDLIARLSGARYRIGIGKLSGNVNPMSFCFTHPVDLDWSQTPRRHQALRNIDILKPLGIGGEDLRAPIGLTDDEQKKGKDYLSGYKNNYRLLIGFHPGAGKVENRWRAGNFNAIANRLANDMNAGIVITAGPMDNEPIEEVKAFIRSDYLLVEHKPIREVAAIIDQLDLFITNDTGIMHVAGGTRTNMLALFGPTDPLQWAPAGQKNRYLCSKDKNINSLSQEEVYGMISIILTNINQEKAKQ